MTAFDPLKAAREELAGLSDVLATCKRAENDAEAAISDAENKLNAARKLRGYCQIAIQQLRAEIADLEAKANGV